MREYLTKAETAARLSCSIRTVERFIKAGTLPVRRLGLRMVRIPASAVDRLLTGKRR